MPAVIGSSNIDVVYTVDHFTLSGETQKAHNLEFHFGGKGGNQAVTLAKQLDKPIYFYSCLGTDPDGEMLAEEYRKLSINGYIFVPSPTGKAYIEVEESSGSNRIVTYAGANNCLSAEGVTEFIEKYFTELDYCLLQNEMPAEACAAAIRILKEKSVKIIYDPAPKEGTDIKIISGVDYLTPNETEFDFLCAECKIEANELTSRAFEFIQKTGIKCLILKRGENGAMLIKGNREIINQPALDIKAVDSTAAGDVFNGSFAAKLSEGGNEKEALKYACVAAAISVTRKGAQSSIPEKFETEKLFRSIDS